MKKAILDPNFDPEGLLVAHGENGSIEGLVHGITRLVPLGTSYDPDDAWVTVLAVRPGARRGGLGGKLMAAAERYAAGKGRKRVLVSPYAPNYYLPGVDVSDYEGGCRFLEARGYRVTSNPVAMDRRLGAFVYLDDVEHVRHGLETEGWKFGPISPDLDWPLLSFCAREFSADWTRALREALSREIEPCQLQVAVRGGAVHGFALFGGYGTVLERFGPFGVRAELRGLGLGKVLLYEALREMKSQGLHTAWFLWTGEDHPAGYLYKRAGFEVTRRFHVYERTLEG